MSDGNRFDQMRAAVRDAEMTLNAADTVAGTMGSLLIGRLHNCQPHVLKDLKRELRLFNANTGTWRKR